MSTKARNLGAADSKVVEGAATGVQVSFQPVPPLFCDKEFFESATDLTLLLSESYTEYMPQMPTPTLLSGTGSSSQSDAPRKPSYLDAATVGLRRRGTSVGDAVSVLHPKSSIAQPIVHASEFMGEASMFSCVVSLTNTCIGAGVLTMPYCISKMGLLFGVASLCAVCVFTSSMVFMAMAASKTMTEGTTFSDIGWRTFPRVMRVIDAMNAFGNIGTISAYLVIVGDNGPHALKHIVDSLGGNKHHWLLRREAVIAIFSGVFLLPAIRSRYLDNMKVVSVFAVTGFMCILIVTLLCAVVPSFKSNVRQHADDYGSGDWFLFPHSDVQTFLSVLPIVALAFNCVPNAMSLTHELRNNSFKRLSAVLCLSMFICVAVYGVVGVSVYLTFGNELQSDFLLNYPTDSWVFTILRLIYAFSVCLSYPVVLYTVRESLSFLVYKRSAIDPQTTDAQFYTLTYGIFAVTFSIAMVTSNLGIVMALAGVLSSSASSFFVPGMSFYCRCTPKGGHFYTPAPGYDKGDAEDVFDIVDDSADVLAANGALVGAGATDACEVCAKKIPLVPSVYGDAGEMWNVWPNWMTRLALFAVAFSVVIVPLFVSVQFI